MQIKLIFIYLVLHLALYRKCEKCEPVLQLASGLLKRAVSFEGPLFAQTWLTCNLVPRRSLLIRCPREVCLGEVTALGRVQE